MNIIEFAARRPVAVSMLAVAVLLFGLVAMNRLEVTLLPDLSYPQVTVRTEFVGAAPVEVESLISKPLEEALGIVKNVRQVRSISRAGFSDVTLEFEWGTPMDFAVLDVREKLDALDLPDEIERPVVLRFDPSSDPIMRLGLALAGDTEPDEIALKRLRRLAEDVAQKQLEAVKGVAAVKISGGLEDEVHIELDSEKLAQLGLTPEWVQQRLDAENVNLSGGRVDEGSLRYLVRTRNQFASLGDMRDLILQAHEGQVVRLKDVARVASAFKERTAIIRIDGHQAVEIAIYREGDSNTVTVARAVRSKLEGLREALPDDLKLTPLSDQSVYIQQAIDGVTGAAILGGVLAVLVLFLFLHDAWATAIIAFAIPVSVIATFVIMYGSGVTLNIMSLGGLALAVGLLVDSAIVVLESIVRQREDGVSALDAAVRGAGQVSGAIVASTLTTVAVFFPMVFVQGIAGQLFSDQALVVSGALLMSLLVALTLIPMLAARRGRKPALVPAAPRVEDGAAWRRTRSTIRIALLEHLPVVLLWLPVRLWRLAGWLLTQTLGRVAGAFRAVFDRIEAGYAPALTATLGHRPLVLLLAAGLLGVALVLVPRLGVELLPQLIQGEFRADVEFAPGTTLEQADAAAQQLQAVLAGDPAVRAVHAVAGSGNRLDSTAASGGEHRVSLTVLLEDPAAEARVTGLLRDRLEHMPGAQFRFERPTLFSLSTPIEIEVAGFDLDAAGHLAERIEAGLRADRRFADIESTLVPGQPEVQIEFDQARVSALGLDVPTLAARVVQAIQGEVATRYRLDDREIDVLVRAQGAKAAGVDALRQLIINPESARPVSLEAVADVQLRRGPGEIRRTGQQRVVVVSAHLASGDLGSALAAVHDLVVRTPIAPGLSVQVTGQSEEMAVSFASLKFALGLAVFLVYLVMAAQFESLVHPFVILFTIPLAGVGAVGALWLTATPVNVVVLIGLIVLAGIVVNNGIVMIDRIRQLRLEGEPRDTAVVDAAAERLRPILMTSLTTILGLVPLAVGHGEGAELRAPMAIAIIGGLLSATLLTLFVVPAVYTLLDLGDPQPQAADALSEV